MIPTCLIRREMQKIKRFYPIISKTKGGAPKIKLLVCHVTRRDIPPPPLFIYDWKILVNWYAFHN